MTSAAHLVVVMGTQYFDASGSGNSDYPITDLIQMMGRASRPNIDDSGECCKMCIQNIFKFLAGDASSSAYDIDVFGT
jgi:replicative superfamily II helicase